MKKAGWFTLGTAVAACLMMACFAASARAQVAGPVADEQVFPDMLKQSPDCNTAYNDFLSVANPLKACEDLEEVNDQIEAKQAFVKDLQAMKGCGACKKKIAEANAAIASYQQQASAFQTKCPDRKGQYQLISQMPAKHKEVCKSCKNKWPGKLGPYAINPCQ